MAEGREKENANFDLWLKDIAPSSKLRKWFGHDAERWPDFKTKYVAELKSKKEALSVIIRAAIDGKVTLLYAARDERHNEAVVLKELIERLRR